MTADIARALVRRAYPSARVQWFHSRHHDAERCRIMADMPHKANVAISRGHKGEGLAWIDAARRHLDDLADDLEAQKGK